MDNQSAPADPTDARVQAALQEYLERIDRGETLDREAFLSQRGEIAEELRSLIDAENRLRKMAAGERSAGGQADERTDTSTQSFALHGQETIAPRAGAKRSADISAIGLNQEFGRYRILKALGQGAMGMVYLAEDTQLQRQVALKTPHFEQEPTPELLERFYREARAAATLRHPNICPVYDVGQIDGKHYISMAFIDGHPLSAFIRSAKPQPERQILIVVRKLAQALQEAHDLGIVHRDLKPANIMVDKRNEPIIMDFGLARQLQRETNIRITQSGMLIGTPAYMSPEQVDGEPDGVGPASDQYSLGVILYELLTGQLPFRGSLTAVMAQIITKETTPPSQLRPELDLRIEAACLKMMAKDPTNRFASLSAAAEEFGAILKNPSAKQTAKDTGKQAAATPPPAESNPATVSVLKSQTKKTVSGKDLVSLEELARKCLARRDYDQVIQIIERIPEVKRSAGLTSTLEKARAKADEIAFLICEIDEAVRINDGRTALKKADELLTLKPGHHCAIRVQEEFSGYGTGGAARIGPLQQFTQPWNEGGWVPWSVLAFGLAIFGVMTAVIVIWLGKSAIEIDVKDPGIEVAVKGTSITITGPNKEKFGIEPGERHLVIHYQGVDFETEKRFEIKKGEKKLLAVSLVDGQIMAKWARDPFPLALIPDKDKVANNGPPGPKPDNGPKADKAERKSAAVAVAGAGNADRKTPAAPQGPRPTSLSAPFEGPAAQTARRQWADYLKQTGEITNTLGMKLVLIPPGEFQMGASKAARSAKDRENPQHDVKITRPFYLSTYEVTRGQFANFVAATAFKTEAERDGGKAATIDSHGEMGVAHNLSWRQPGFDQEDSHPVVIVSWNDANAFCRWLSEKEGRTYRLPTEAEWEYACRAGTTTPLISGTKLVDLFSVGNGIDATFREHFHMPAPDPRPHDGFVFTAPVGSFLPNRFGLFDMHGNAWEWCQDWFGPYTGARATDPTGPTQGEYRVSRGGGFDCGVSATSSARDFLKPTDRLSNVGFRVVCATALEVGAPAPNAESPSTPEFVPLFNGRDLSGWKTHPSQPGDWRVDNSVLIGLGPGRSHLYTERGDFHDFHLRVEARINAPGNSGIFVRASFGPRWPQKDPQWPWGYEAQVECGGRERHKTGSLYVAERGAVVSINVSPVAANEWFTEELIIQGNQIVIKVNGKITADYLDPARRFVSGHLALQQHDPQTVVEFRKIEIKELGAPKSTTNIPSQTADGALTAPFDATRYLIVNGSFEEGPPLRRFVPLNPGSTAITGWTVTRGQIDYVGKDHWNAADGDRSIDLHGSPGYGGIKQTFKTTNGQRYRVTFSLAGSPQCNHPIKRIAVVAAGAKGVYTFDSTGKTSEKMGWVRRSFEFNAVSDETTLEIYTLEKRDPIAGPALDDVQVTEVPQKK